ncbi:MAG: hypothetical protein H6Q21_1164 [Bacteroidetes bacterium]|nr:hypothetical protein [Bacteroidota bacterium]
MAMKKLLLTTLSIMLLFGCSSTKKMMQRGDYDAVIQKCVKSLLKDKSNEEDAVMLDKAYKLANERDQDRIKYLKTENDPASFDEIYSLYSALKARQSTVKKVLPLKIEGRTVQYPHVDYDKYMIEAKKKAADYYYDNATKLMKVNTKDSYRQAYYEFNRAKDYYGSAYPGINNLINESKSLGTSRVLLNVINNTMIKLPNDFINDIITFDPREFENEWLELHFQDLDNTIVYDYYADFVLQFIDISPDLVSDKDHVEKKTIEDGFNYVLDSKGNVMKDSLGNDIKVKKYKEISCSVIETLQQKDCTIKGNLELTSANPKKLLKKEPVAATTHFEHLSARAIGDINALKPETQALLKSGRIPFPDNFSMIYDCTETLKMALHDALKANISLIR